MEARSFQTLLGLTEHRSRIFALVVAMVQDYDIAEDLFQDSVAEILKSESSYDPSRDFSAWACGIARNVVRQHWRRQQKAPSTGACELLEELATVGIEADDETWKLERRALRRCFQRIPERMQKLLILRYGHNMKGHALAKAASVRIGSVRTTLARLRGQLRQCIQAQMLDHPKREP